MRAGAPGHRGLSRISQTIRPRWRWLAALVSLGVGAVLLVPHQVPDPITPACPAISDGVMVRVPGGTVQLGGTDAPDDGPLRTVTVAPFRMDATEVTNAQYAAFVRVTGYRTLAERVPDPADNPGIPASALVPGSAVFVPPESVSNLTDISQWWRFVAGASWLHPSGPGSDTRGLEAYPVVHIAYADAVAYANWRGHRLPSEAEWELAARGGLEGQRFAWGDVLTPGGKHQANVWEGVFPIFDAGTDGYKGASPVGCFKPNLFGLYDMIGNVWELTVSRYPGESAPGSRIIKGGSFLCAPNYCARYRPAARQPGDPTLGASHIGFRTVVSG